MSGQIHILVAEDNPALSSVVRFNLQRAGYRATVAPNGREAWDVLQSEPVDLLLTDEQMPEMTGRQLCELIQQDDRFGGMPIIMLTAKGLELELHDLRDRLGIDDVLAKPFSPAALLIAIDKRLRAESPA